MGTQTGAAGADAPVMTGGEGHLTGYGTKAYRSYVLNALFFVYILNFLDRGLLGIVSEPVMNELQITDGQFGLLTGIGFALFYSVVGIPLARYAEYANRTWITQSASRYGRRRRRSPAWLRRSRLAGWSSVAS